jgi:hypothetical protein
MRSPPAFGAKTGGLFENRPFLLRYHFAMNAKHERNSGMPRKAADFFISIVRPTVEEFLRDTGDLRRGFLATIVLYHTADYWFRENKIKYNDDLSSLHGDLIKNRPEFTVIRDVADASKHGELLRPQKKNRRNLSSSDQVNVINDFFSDGVSIFSYVPDVKYTLDDGSSGSLEGAVRSVLSMWETMLQQPWRHEWAFAHYRRERIVAAASKRFLAVVAALDGLAHIAHMWLPAAIDASEPRNPL